MNPVQYTSVRVTTAVPPGGHPRAVLLPRSQPGNGFHQLHDQRALSIAKSKPRWEVSATTGTPTVYLDLKAPAIPLSYRGAPVTGMQLMDVLTDTNIWSADGTKRVVDFGRPALDGRVLLP
jgi:hypothetical protein